MKAKLYIKELNWYVNVLYNVNYDNLDSIIDDLKSIGCPDYFVYDMIRNIGDCEKNCGLIYTNNKTFMVIFKSNKLQTINTISHECYHFGRHIDAIFNLDEESIAQIVGNLCMKLCQIILF